MSQHVLKLLYFSQVYSHLTYGIGLLGNHIPTHMLHQLQKAQNKCIGIVVNKLKININGYQEIGLICVNEIIKLENIRFAYKLNKNLPPNKIHECSLHDYQGHSLVKQHRCNTRQKSLPNTPKVTGKYYLKSIFCASIKEFRTLKEETKKAPTLNSFVKRVKEMIMKGENTNNN